MNERIPLWRMARLTLCCASALSIGCAGESPSSSDPDTSVTAPVVSWEAFMRSVEPTMRIVDGEKVYIVEWDIPIREAELHEYYLRSYVDTEKSTGAVLSDGVTDNKWATPNHLALTYCVSTGFGDDYARMQAEMERATLAWTRAAGVRFIYLSAEDGNCTDANSNVEIPLKPHSGGGACAFFPVDNTHCTGHGRALVINIADVDSWATTPNPNDGIIYANMTTEGTLRHELGHILGLRHEHIREANNNVGGICAAEIPNPGPFRVLTEYDVNSAMHYPWCDGVILSEQLVTTLDSQGAQRLYGPPAWRVAAL